MTPAQAAQVLTLCDQGRTPASIAAALTLHRGKVYALLRAERPFRKRAPRPLTSAVPARIAALRKAGVGAARIGRLLGVSRAYVYRALANAESR